MERFEKACSFTGHRALPQGKGREIERRLEDVTAKLYHHRGVRRFASGGALGFDLLAAETVLRLRAVLPDVELLMALPFPDYDRFWPYRDILRARSIVDRADGVVYVQKEGASGGYFARNRFLIDHATVCVAYLNKMSGGTFYTVNYARERGVEVVNLAAMASDKKASPL